MGKRKKKRAARNASNGDRRRGLTLGVGRLEIARGHDGFLRGKPEPVIVLAALLLEDDARYMMGRALHAFRVTEPYPCVAKSDTAALSVRVNAGDRGRLVIVAAAIERDDGQGVEAVYAALAEPQALYAWWPHAPMPEPCALGDLAAFDGALALSGAAVRLLHEGRDLAEHALGDDWVGACLGVLDVGPLGVNEQLRLRFIDASGRNDWTALLDVKIA